MNDQGQTITSQQPTLLPVPELSAEEAQLETEAVEASLQVSTEAMLNALASSPFERMSQAAGTGLMLHDDPALLKEFGDPFRSTAGSSQ